jgi:hypothetical protein
MKFAVFKDQILTFRFLTFLPVFTSFSLSLSRLDSISLILSAGINLTEVTKKLRLLLNKNHLNITYN